jgi:hypothetical protein
MKVDVSKTKTVPETKIEKIPSWLYIINLEAPSDLTAETINSRYFIEVSGTLEVPGVVLERTSYENTCKF